MFRAVYLTTDAVITSDTSVNFNHIIWRNILQSSHLHIRREENLVSYICIRIINKLLLLFLNNSAGVAQSVQRLITDWTTGQTRFDPRVKQRFFPLASVSRPALSPPSLLYKGTDGPFHRGKAQSGRDADKSSHLFKRSRMSKSYIHTLPIGACMA
jgi:hypothetical protein